ncbi:hypothetical protein [Klebsiella phage 05F01]|nr:hypothetical protein [Klebsiella phage 05F01]
MKVIVNFKPDNGFIPYCLYGDVAWKLCSKFGPTLYPKFIGGTNPIYPLPKSIGTDLTLDSLFDIFSFKSVRVEFIPPHEIELTVPGFRESWLED